MDRTMVKATASENCISFRTVSRKRKSPQRFCILRSELDQLHTQHTVYSHDIHSFAALHLDPDKNILQIRFTWLSDCGSNGPGGVKGYEEMVKLDYSDLSDFIIQSMKLDNPPESWAGLSIDDTGRRPRLDFSAPGARETLRRIQAVPHLRHKLARALRYNFNWPGSDVIRFYHDWDPYSFFFREGRGGICGGLILHGQEDMSKAKYSIHT